MTAFMVACDSRRSLPLRMLMRLFLSSMGVRASRALDEHFAQVLRKRKMPVILAVNKAENEKRIQSTIAEAYSLGLWEPITISAEHGTGMEELYHALVPLMPEEGEEDGQLEEASDDFGDIDAIEGDEDFILQQEEDDPEKPLKLAIVGRPNVGKSTLLNAIVRDQRVMTGPEAGITRDAIAVDWVYKDRAFKLVDTAGIRRKSKVQDTIEKMSVEDSHRAIRLAQIVVLVLDAQTPLEKQDLQIAQHIVEEGRALVLCINKWDLVTDKEKFLEDIDYKIGKSLEHITGVPIVTLSALEGRNIGSVLKRSLEAYEVWNQRVSTGKLNRWLAGLESRNPAPLVSGRQNRLKYIAQIKTRPPTFALWVSRPDKLPPAYKRYVINALRRDYDLAGTPIRLLVRRSKNPYS